MSEGEWAKPRRRRGRRRGRRAAGPPRPGSDVNVSGRHNIAAPAEGAPDTAKPRPATPHSGDKQGTTAAKPNGQPRAKPDRKPKPRPRRAPNRLRTVHETSAGGLVVDGIDGPKEQQVAALIGRLDRRGRMLWSLPKGHIEMGETAEQTAIREVAEETGIEGAVLAALGRIDYWFVTEGRRVHKTVHHYLMRFLGGELSDDDVEVSEVAWVPLSELPRRLAYADERRLAEVAGELIDTLQTHGPQALPPLPQMAPRRRPQTHSHTRNSRRRDDTAAHSRGEGHEHGAAKPSGRRTNGCGKGP
ncbi:NUDIX hydrolase [Mycolicibacterium thermoresistibile]